MDREQKRPQTRRDYFGPLLLIIIGLIFLASNLGLLPGEGWGTVFRLWPLLLIVAGLNDLLRGDGLIWPLLMMAVGAFLLLNYFGPREYVSWSSLLKLWPILLIAGGIDLILKEHTIWTTIIGLVLAAALIGGGYWLAVASEMPSRQVTEIRQEIAEDYLAAVVSLSLGAGQLEVDDFQQEGLLVSGTVSPDRVDEDLRYGTETLEYSLTADQPAVYPNRTRWDLNLNQQIRMDVQVENGAGEVFLAAEGLALNTLEVEQGVGRLVVRLPDKVNGEVRINQAVGQLTLILPEDAAVEIQVRKGLSVLDYPRDLVELDGVIRSKQMGEDHPRMEIILEQAVGRIDIQYAR